MYHTERPKLITVSTSKHVNFSRPRLIYDIPCAATAAIQSAPIHPVANESQSELCNIGPRFHPLRASPVTEKSRNLVQFSPKRARLGSLDTRLSKGNDLDHPRSCMNSMDCNEITKLWLSGSISSRTNGSLQSRRHGLKLLQIPNHHHCRSPTPRGKVSTESAPRLLCSSRNATRVSPIQGPPRKQSSNHPIHANSATVSASTENPTPDPTPTNKSVTSQSQCRAIPTAYICKSQQFIDPTKRTLPPLSVQSCHQPRGTDVNTKGQEELVTSDKHKTTCPVVRKLKSLRPWRNQRIVEPRARRAKYSCTPQKEIVVTMELDVTITKSQITNRKGTLDCFRTPTYRQATIEDLMTSNPCWLEYW